MTEQLNIRRIALALFLASSMGACQTVKLPKIDIMKSPEFSEDAANIATDYPDVKEAPTEPTDLRSDKQWDRDARALQALKNRSSKIKPESGPTKAEAAAQFKKLKARAQAYKKDDPASGPVQGFPKYKPRR